jgi:catechol 2,3-dioxygenase-like lactoylglutathione lyase family enzyme
MSSSAFKGLRTVIYAVDDLDAAKDWYTRILGTEPYFDEPFYVGYNIGGYELGLSPDAADERGSPVAYWGVDDAEAALERLLDLGATPHGDVEDVGDGIRVATVEDPFGNVVGIIENPHFELPDTA